MIFWLLAGGIVLLAFYLLLRKRPEPYAYDSTKTHRWWWAPFGATLLFGALGLTFYVTASTGMIQSIHPSLLNKYDVHLSSLSDGSGTKGQFFLGSGYVDNERVIAYVYGDDSYGYRTTNSDADYSVIYQDASPSSAHLTVLEYGADNWVFLPFRTHLGYEMTHYEFHVPKGSIVSNFRVDSQ